jgi:hypothetical protein
VTIESAVALVAEVGPTIGMLEYDLSLRTIDKYHLLMLYVPLLVVVAVTRVKKGLIAYAALVGPLSSVHPNV